MTRRDAPAPMLRRGPRPLLMHLTLNLASPPNSPSSAANSPGSDDVSSSSKPGAGAPSPAPAPARLDPALVAGIAAYRRHPYARDLPDPPVLWQDGASCLYDYGRADPDDDALPVLFVPSLINRGTILDLTATRSMLRWLGARRMRPLLLEWGWPGERERRFGLADYVTRRLEPAMAAAAASDRRGRIVLCGYCMGGLLAMAAAQRRREMVAALCLIATPWDFHAGSAGPAAAASRLRRLDALMHASGSLPVDAIQAAFASLDPAAVAAKFRRFGNLAQDDDATRLFVAIEDWLNDGVPLAAPVARDCLDGWYGENRPARGTWRVAGTTIDPAALDLPTLLVVPRHDRIVPPESALALKAMIRRAKLLQLPGGHVGIVAGPRAPELLWTPLLRWLRRQARTL